LAAWTISSRRKPRHR